MLDQNTTIHVQGVIDALPGGGGFSLHDLNIPGYAAMTAAQCRGIGKRLDDSVRRKVLDRPGLYTVSVIAGSSKPQLYRKNTVQPVAAPSPTIDPLSARSIPLTLIQTGFLGEINSVLATIGKTLAVVDLPASGA